VTFYNGLVTSQTVPIGTVFTSGDGVQVSTDQSVTIPAANPPQEGEATVTATTIRTGSISNIHSYDINTAFSSSLFVKNLQAFTGGRDARDYKAVSPQDIQTVTSTLKQTLAQIMPQAFPLAPEEALILSHCLFAVTPSHQPGDEAATVTLKSSYTCQGHAYNAQAVINQSTAVFTSTRPGAQYQLFGTVHAQVSSVSPVRVTVSGTWVYTFSKDYEESLAEHIAGDSPARARAYLLKTGVIAQATIPTTLPDAMYIQFLVLISV
jgi:hypothetical protein